MSDKKFTKGEWHLQDVEYHKRNTLCVVTDHFDVISPDIGIRNVFDAQLIAAAPEMYKALKEIVEGHKKDVGGGFLCSHELIDAESALAKARGEQ